MIAIPIIFFILPILFRTLQINSIRGLKCIRILAPTIIAYSLWNIISIFLILIGISLKSYFIIFYFFPIGLLVFEFISLFRNQKNIYISKITIYFIIFLFIFGIISIFSFASFGDAVTYMKFGIDSLKENNFAPSNPIYRYISFYYIAVILGAYEMQLFYSIFFPLIFSTIAFFVIADILEKRYAIIYKTPYVVIFSILISLWVNSTFGANWPIGFLIPLFFILWNLNVINEDEKNKGISIDFFIPFLIITLFNFSTTSVLVGVPFYVIFFILSILRNNSNLKVIFFLPTTLFLIVLPYISVGIDNYFTIILTLYLISFLSTFLLFIFFRNSNLTISLNFLDFVNSKINITNSFLKIKKSKILITIFIIFATLLLMELIYYFFHQGMQVINNLSPTSGNPQEKNTNTTEVRFFRHFTFWNILTFEIIVFLFIIFAIFSNNYNLIIMMPIFLIVFGCYYTSTKIPFLLPYYVVDRVIYGLQCYIVFFSIILGFYIFEKNKKFFLLPILSFSTCFAIINPFTIMVTIFSTGIVNNKIMTNEKDMKFLMQHWEYLNSKKQIFSEVENPFLTSLSSYVPSTIANNFYYDRFLHKTLKTTNSPFSFQFSNSSYDNGYLDFIIEKLNSNYFDLLILRNKSVFIDSYIVSHYNSIYFNNDISLWALKE